MRKSILLFLPISVFSFLLFASCAVHQVEKGVEKLQPDRSVFRNLYFDNPRTDYVYKANIEVYGNTLTGIFIIKKIKDASHRVVFTTEFGNTLFDFEVSENDFTVNSIVEELNRKLLLKTLEKDFHLLLQKDAALSAQFEKNGQKVYKGVASGKYSNYFFVGKDGGKLSEILHTTKTKEKIKLSFTAENDIFAQKIIIQHYDIPLRMELNHFKQD